MNKHCLSLITLFLLSTYGIFGFDRLDLDITVNSLAMQLGRGEKIDDMSINKLFDLLSPLDRDDSKPQENGEDREKVIENWRSFMISLAESQNEKMAIENFSSQVSILSKKESISTKVLEKSLNRILAKY
jgi:hypothetical protein